MWSVLWGAASNRQGLGLLVWITSGLELVSLSLCGWQWVEVLKVHWPYLQTLNAPHDLGHQTTSGLYFYPSRFVSRCEVGFFSSNRANFSEGRNRVPGCSWSLLNTKTTLFVFLGLRRDISHAANTSFHTVKKPHQILIYFFVFILFVSLDK